MLLTEEQANLSAGLCHDAKYRYRLEKHLHEGTSYTMLYKYSYKLRQIYINANVDKVTMRYA